MVRSILMLKNGGIKPKHFLQMIVYLKHSKKVWKALENGSLAKELSSLRTLKKDGRQQLKQVETCGVG